MNAMIGTLFMGGVFGLLCLLLHRSLRALAVPATAWALFLVWAVLMLALLQMPAQAAPLADVFRANAGR